MTVQRPAARDGQEIWESSVPGTIWVTVVNDRGRERNVSVGGRSGARLRIATEDREICQEQVVDDVNDPFTNGMLRRLDVDQNDDPKTASLDARSTEELMTVFALQGKQFMAAVDDLGQVSVRRLLEMTDAIDATVKQVEYLKASIERRWPVSSGSMPVYKELAQASQVAGG